MKFFIKKFETKNRKYIYDINNSLLYEVGTLHNLIIDMINENMDTRGIVNLLCDRYDITTIENSIDEIYDMINIGIKSIDQYKNEIENNHWSIDSLSFILTRECNFSCKYCYINNDISHEDVMSFDVAQKSVDYLLSNSADDIVMIIFFGGEPLMNKEVLLKTIKYANRKKKEYNKEILYSITTNATLLDDELLEILIKNKCLFNISIDGDSKTHDVCRTYKNGKGTFQDIIRNIEKIPKNLKQARGTLTNFNKDLYKLQKELFNYDFNNVHFEVVSSDNDLFRIHDENLDKIVIEYNIICEEIYDSIIKGKFNSDMPVYGQVKDDLEKIDNQTNLAYFCKASKSYFSVDVDGKLYPCHRFVGMKKYYIGDVFDGINNNNRLFLDSNVFNKHKCQKCWAKFLCGGGCYYDSLLLMKDINVPNNQKCFLIKSFLEISFKLYLRLIEEGFDVTKLYRSQTKRHFEKT